MADPVTPSLPLWTFDELEEELESFLRLVPWDPINQTVWSPRLASLMLNSCSSIDSAFRSFLADPNLDGVPGIAEIRQKTQLDIEDYRLAYAPAYPLTRKTVYLISDQGWHEPWERWERPSNGNHTPPWWTIYNKLKHDRFANILLATLDQAVASLAALFSLCAVLLPIRLWLYRAGRLSTMPFRAPGLLDKYVVLPDPGAGEDALHVPFLSRSRLFVIFLSCKCHEEDRLEALDAINPVW